MASPELVAFAHAISRVLGWTYFLCWSLSFYPQPYHNWRRRSVAGLAIDFPLLNVPSFFAYTVYTYSLLFSPTILSQYAQRHPKAPRPTVRANDFAFALHALILSVITLSQFSRRLWGFKAGAGRVPHRWVLGVMWGCIVGVLCVVFIVWSRGDEKSDVTGWCWLDVIYALSYTKLIISLLKFLPQLWLHYKLKSTRGWSIWQPLLDFFGGIFSLLQLVIDSSLENDWSGVTGNIAKFILGNLSIFINIMFFTQHYILYRDSDTAEAASAHEQQRLVEADGDRYEA